MSGTSAGNRPKRPTPPHKAVISHLRMMRASLMAAIDTWNVRASVTEVVREIPRESTPLPLSIRIVDANGKVSKPGEPHQWVEQVRETRKRRPDEYPQAESANWDALWKLAVHTRDMADRLASYAQQQGRLAREAAHPANRPANYPMSPEEEE